MSTEEQVRRVLAEHGNLGVDADRVAVGADLYRSGLTSHASITVMLALEDTFDLEFPDRLVRKSTFESIAAIVSALGELGAESLA